MSAEPPKKRNWLAIIGRVILFAAVLLLGWQKHKDDMKGRAADMGWRCESAVREEESAERLKAIQKAVQGRPDSRSK